MSEIAIGERRGPDSVLPSRTIALLLVIGVLGFAGFLLLGAYAPDLRSGRNAGAHALSNAATGYAGLVELAQARKRQAHDAENIAEEGECHEKSAQYESRPPNRAHRRQRKGVLGERAQALPAAPN